MAAHNYTRSHGTHGLTAEAHLNAGGGYEEMYGGGYREAHAGGQKDLDRASHLSKLCSLVKDWPTNKAKAIAHISSQSLDCAEALHHKGLWFEPRFAGQFWCLKGVCRL